MVGVRRLTKAAIAESQALDLEHQEQGIVIPIPKAKPEQVHVAARSVSVPGCRAPGKANGLGAL